MKKGKRRRGRALRPGAAATAVAVTAVWLSLPLSPASASRPPEPPVPLPTPLTTSVQTSYGTWATLPMGNLQQSQNTFWQLFFRPTGEASWSNQVQATATATNGGLVLAPAEGRGLIVGIRPSQGLTFSPLISTSDGARTWSDGLIDGQLAARPDAIAVDGDDEAVALVGGPGNGQVLTAVGGISNWRTLTTERTLAAATKHSCGLELLTAVGYQGGAPLMAGECSHPGVVGLFSHQTGGWRLTGPVLPPSFDNSFVQVLALEPGPATASALLAVGRGHLTKLVATSSNPDGQWRTSPALALRTDQHIASFGSSVGTGFFVLLSSASGPETLVASQGSNNWEQLPSPPVGTKTVAFGPGQTVTALAASPTVLTAWSLRPPSDAWVKTQVMEVQIQYGSSS